MRDLEALRSAFDSANTYAEWSTLVVVIGLILEFGALLYFSKEIHPIERKLLILGSILVTLGVGGEYVFSARASNAASKLQQASDQKVAELDRQSKSLAAETESEKLARVKIEKAIVDELAPRDINKEQMGMIASALKGHVGTIYLYPLADVEASRYMYAITETLKAAGADPKLMISGTHDVPRFPDKFDVAVSITGVTVYESNGKHALVDLIVQAFLQAGIRIQGQWTEGPLAGVIDGKWVADAGVQSPAIFVGLKPTPFMQFPAYATPSGLEKYQNDHPPPWQPR
jgi:hypothetical protein